MNSVYQEITAASIATEVMLERRGSQATAILVEGSTDSKFYKGFFDLSLCNITACRGKQMVIDAVYILERRGFVGLIAIVDADFDRIVDKNYSDNIVMTQHNDVESMIFFSEALERILYNYGSLEKINAHIGRSSGISVRSIITDQAKFLGCMRFISMTKGWNLKFEGMTYQFENNRDVTLNQDSVIDHVIARSSSPHCLDRTYVRDLIDCEIIKLNDEQLCCGHDLCRLLARGLRYAFGSHSRFEGEEGLKELGRIMRLAFHADDFRESPVYQELMAWEQRNAPWRFLK